MTMDAVVGHSIVNFNFDPSKTTNLEWSLSRTAYLIMYVFSENKITLFDYSGFTIIDLPVALYPVPQRA